MKLLATSDLHLGRHSSLPLDESDDDITASTRTWHRIVEYAVREEMDAVLMAGDLVDEANHFYEATYELEKGINRLADAGVPVVMVSGNHDHNVLPEMVDRIQSEFVHLLGRDGRWESRTITVRSGEQLMVTGWSYPQNQARFLRNPMDSFVKPHHDGLPAVGLLHCDVDQSGSAYAPVASADFESTTLDYWILGHIHKPVTFRSQAPEVFYPGAPHPFDAGESETGFLRIITTGNRTSTVSLTPVRFRNLVFEVPEVDENRMRGMFLEKLKEVAEDPDIRSDELRLLVLTVRCRGTVTALQRFLGVHQDLTTEYMAVDDHLQAVVRKWIEEPRTDVDLKRLARNSDPAGLLASWLSQMEAGDLSEELEQLLTECREEYRNLAGHRVFEPLKKSVKPDEDMIREMFRSRGMILLETLLKQVEGRS